MKTSKEMAELLAAPVAEMLYENYSLGNFDEGRNFVLESIPLVELLDAASLLRKYQARYHGAEHAQKDWERGREILDALSARLADVLSSSPS